MNLFRLIPAVLMLAALNGCQGPSHSMTFANGVEAFGLVSGGQSYPNVVLKPESPVCIYLPNEQLVPLSQITIEFLRALQTDPIVVQRRVSVKPWEYDPNEW